ncbi:MAG TPA: APC family permease [Candidatus Acidoferrales bacterium]
MRLKTPAATVAHVTLAAQSSSTDAPARSRSTLRHNYLSFTEDTALTLGVMAPTGTCGIVLPLLIAKGGNATWLIFLFTLVAFSLITYSVHRFSAQCASAGSLADFASAGLGRGACMVTGWAYVAAMAFGAAGTAPSSAYYADLFFRQITGAPASFLRAAAITAIVVIAAWIIAHRDIKLSTEVMLAIELSSLAVIIVIIALAMRHNSTWLDRPQLHLDGAKLSGFQFAMVFGFMTVAGFESVTTLGEEASHARRTIPRVIVSCLIPVGILYLVMIYCLTALARKNGLALDQLNAPFDAIARSMNLASFGYVSSVGIALSYFACTLGSLNAGARVLYYLAQNRMFAPSFGSAHPVNKTPHRAIALISLIAIACPAALLLSKVLLPDCINYLTQLASYGFIGSYFLVCLAMPFFLLRRKILRRRDVAVSAAALMILAAVLALSVFPVPAAPWRYLPYLFLGAVLIGIAVSVRYARSSDSNPVPDASDTRI